MLVVVGILLALQIDTWNEDRKINESSRKHLKILKQNILDERKQLDKLTQIVDENILATDSLFLQFMKFAKADINTIKYISLLNIEFELKPIRSGIETILKADELSYLDQKIQDAIHNYYQKIDDVRVREDKMNTYISEKYEPYIFAKYINIFQKNNPWDAILDLYSKDLRDAIPFDYEKLMNDKLLEAHVFARHFHAKKVKAHYSNLYVASDELLALLKDF